MVWTHYSSTSCLVCYKIHNHLFVSLPPIFLSCSLPFSTSILSRLNPKKVPALWQEKPIDRSAKNFSRLFRPRIFHYKKQLDSYRTLWFSSLALNSVRFKVSNFIYDTTPILNGTYFNASLPDTNPCWSSTTQQHIANITKCAVILCQNTSSRLVKHTSVFNSTILYYPSPFHLYSMHLSTPWWSHQEEHYHLNLTSPLWRPTRIPSISHHLPHAMIHTPRNPLLFSMISKSSTTGKLIYAFLITTDPHRFKDTYSIPHMLLHIHNILIKF